MTYRLRLLALAAALVLAAPLAVPVVAGEAAVGVPQTGLKTVPLTIHTATGKHRYTVEVAATPEQQATGMMYRRTMAADHGMLFPFSSPRLLTFWMENTWLPLDLVFIGADGRVVSVAADAKPMSRDQITSSGPALTVLELGGGAAARIGVRPGDKVSFKLPR